MEKKMKYSNLKDFGIESANSIQDSQEERDGEHKQ